MRKKLQPRLLQRPVISKMPQSNQERSVISLINPKSPASEAYRVLRTNIQFSSADTEIKLLMVTSAGPGEGKSTTVSNLAVTYAQAEEKVLVIDADLRKPTMHRTFKLSNRKGLTNILTNQAQPWDAITASDVPNLDFITSGPIPPNPAELLGSRRMSALLEELKKQYSKIIIDTPPILALTDAQIISTLCDGVILVLDSGKVKKEIAQKAKESLSKVNAKILGVVLNNVSAKDNEAYYYYYYQYYGKEE